MKVLYYDCFCGISGDMNLGALLDLGVDREYLLQELSKLPLESEYELMIHKRLKMGITGTKVDVVLKSEGQDHPEPGQPEGHSHVHSDRVEGEPVHQHRNLRDIEEIIQGSGLNDRVRELSLEMFRTIARAEAKIHGKSVEEVHFHEVGAIDSIVDLVGAAIALDYLNVDKIMASPVQVGGGFVRCAHGRFPVPAPATVEILTGIPMETGLVPFETTTPTGAAILAVNVDQFTSKTDFTIARIGYGIGERDLEIPNVLRVYLGEMADRKAEVEQYILETNIDDMNPELYTYIEELLFEKGALDVFKTPIIMKKGRPAIKLSVLVAPPQEREVMEVIYRETTSLGIRKFRVEKMMLRREVGTVETEYGPVEVKTAYYKGETVKYKAEYEDCRKAAKTHHVPIARIYRAVDQVMAKIRD